MTMKRIHTIGYGNRKLNDFISILKNYGISILVDVRRYPRSKNPEYNREELERELLKHGIRYIFMGEQLGGFRRGYQKYMKTKAYKDGIEALLKLTKEGNAALMCLELKPEHCHRRYICETLENMGVEIVHITTKPSPK